MIYVILGMHKSGTTLLAQIFHHSGINMDTNLATDISYDQGNKYERQSVLALNIALLTGSKGRSILKLAPSEIRPIIHNQRSHMKELIQRYNEQYPHWGFKDPRTCLVYPIWESELPKHKIIVIYRSHMDIWPRYRKKKVHNYYRQPYQAWQFMKNWCEYNNNILSYLNNTEMDFLVLNYHKLMTTQTEFEHLEKFAGIKLTDQRRMDLYRSRSEKSPLIEIATWAVYKQTGLHPKNIMVQFEALANTSRQVN